MADRCSICGCLVYEMEEHLIACERRRRDSLSRDVDKACNMLDSVAHRLRGGSKAVHQDIWDVLMTMELAAAELKAHALEKDPSEDVGSMRCEKCGEEVHKSKMVGHPCEFLRRAGTAKRAFRLQRSIRRAAIRAEKEGMPEWLVVYLKGMILSIEDLARELVRHRNEARKQ